MSNFAESILMNFIRNRITMHSTNWGEYFTESTEEDAGY